ncbi:MAG: SUMF1/EgtB/PvdO family nonheme iron enzyme [Cyanobacteria bacterium J06648_10]
MGDTGRKIALLIGVGDYGTGLKSLQCPANGVTAMETVLKNPEIGGFDEVVPILNPDVGEMRSRISTTLAQLKKDDLVLFYFTGHGIKSASGDFYLTTAQSQLFENGHLITGTAVEADFIKGELRNCYAERKVIVLDCCFGGAFADGFLTMDSGAVDVEAELGDKGWCVMTAATSQKYALEPLGEDLSVYTRYLVEGLKTGGAALDGQAFVSVRHWHDYVKQQVKVAAPTTEPAIFNGLAGENIWVARAKVDNLQRYRKQVQKKVRRGRLSAAARTELSAHWQPLLGITPEQAKAIADEVLKPYREKAKHLALYAQALAEEKEIAYPFDDELIAEFKSLQRTFGLSDRDVQAEEKRILGEQMRAQPVVHMENREVLKKSKQFPTFSFETVRVNEQGEIVETVEGKASYFTEDLGNGVTLDIVRIPDGKFLMGAAKAEEGANKDEYPQHEVRVPEFWIGKFAVTQAQWSAVAKLAQVERELDSDPAKFKGTQRLVEQVSWDDAVEFCQRLSQQAEKDYSLPSEAQWEYACRAEATTPFYFGETLTPNLANYDGNYTYGKGPKGTYREKTTEVGIFSPNSFGLYDMHGNIWEWCLDGWHDTYENAPTDGNVWKSSDERKVLRGGSWGSNPANCRSAHRDRLARDGRIHNLGFRVMMIAPRT